MTEVQFFLIFFLYFLPFRHFDKLMSPELLPLKRISDFPMSLLKKTKKTKTKTKKSHIKIPVNIIK